MKKPPATATSTARPQADPPQAGPPPIAPARVAVALLIVAVPIALGALARSPYLIPALVPAFVAADYFGRWRQQSAAQPHRGLALYIAFVSIRQLVVVTGLYLFGRGLGALFFARSLAELDGGDLGALVAFHMVVFAAGLLTKRLT